MTDAIRLLVIWLLLLALLALTVAATFIDLGGAAPLVSYGIAAAKAGLILWFFMEMRREAPLVRLATVAGLLWMAILLAITATDYATRAAGEDLRASAVTIFDSGAPAPSSPPYGWRREDGRKPMLPDDQSDRRV